MAAPPGMTRIIVDMPSDEAAEFRRLLDAEDKKASPVIRRMIRDYMQSKQEVPAG